MECPSCRTENPGGAKFCMGCGSALSLRCATCSSELPAQAKFCLECGTPVAASTRGSTARADEPVGPPSLTTSVARYIPKELLARLESARATGGMRGERRIVTMLFCDVKGSTAAAEKLDPEEWADIMNGAFEHLIAPVYRYEGTLARLMGDAILAFFGAPMAHEDDPQRAILAGLAIVSEIEGYKQQVKRRWGIDFDVRVGINTGLVVVGEVGTDLRLEYTAMGDAVNLAARMEQAATPGTVLVAADTHKQVAPLFDFDEGRAIDVKGKSEPVTAYRVLGPKTRPGRLRGIEGLDSPMIGRDAELAALRGAAESVCRGSGQIVSSMGEAGLGKSRLASELRATLDAWSSGEPLEWLEARCLSFQSQAPLAPFVDLFARLFRIDPTEESTDAYTRVETALQDIDADQARDWAPALGLLLELSLPQEVGKRLGYLEPPARRRVIHDAITQVLRAKATTGPVVLVLEDLHWADSSTLELAEGLMGLTDGSMLLLVNVFRPRREEGSWKLHEVGAREHAHRYLEISLKPLSADRSRELVQNLLFIEGLPESLRRLIVDKCDGNPFFVEEVIRSLIDASLIERDGDHWRATADVRSLNVPDTLAGVLTTRLDGLEETSRRVAQTAAVLGREVEFDVLAAIYEPFETLGPAVEDLQRRGILREKARLPRRILEFKHALTRDAAYDAMLHKTRRELHRRAAEIFVKTTRGRDAEVATHYLAARDNVSALPWVVKAADRAAKDYATPEAIRWYDQALSILETASYDAEIARHVYEARGSALMLSNDADGALENYAELRRAGEQESDSGMIASALNKMGMVLMLMRADIDGALRMLDEAEAVSQAASDGASLAEGSMLRCGIYTSRAEFDNAYRFLDRAAELGSRLQAEEPLLYGYVHICNTLVYMTEFDRAREKVEEAKALATEKGNLKYLSEIRTFSEPSCLVREGDVQGALDAIADGIAIAERIGHVMASTVGHTLEGQLRTLRGELARAVECNQRAVAHAMRTQVPYYQSWALCTMGTTYLQVSEKLREIALEKHEMARQIMRSPWGNVLGAMNFCELGFCCLAFGKDEDAAALFARGLDEPSPPMRMVKPLLHVGLALAETRRGATQVARQHVDEGRAFAESRKMRQYAPALALAHAGVARADGDAGGALELLLDAGMQAERLGFRPADLQAHATAAEIAEELGRTADARAYRDRALDIAESIRSEFQDPSLRAMYAAHVGRTLGVRLEDGATS